MSTENLNAQQEQAAPPTKEEIIKACQNSNCYADVLRNLGLALTGGNHTTVKKYITEFGIDISNWHYKAGSRAQISLDELLTKGSRSTRASSLRDRVIKGNIIDYRCEKCGISSWMDEEISLHLDHINGDYTDNRIKNLRFLCPNCHSQTPTYGTRNLKRKLVKTVCKECGKNVSRGSIYCQKCASKHRKQKIDWPDSEQLLEMIVSSSCLAVSKILKVSDNAIRKHLKKAGIDLSQHFRT